MLTNCSFSIKTLLFVTHRTSTTVLFITDHKLYALCSKLSSFGQLLPTSASTNIRVGGCQMDPKAI